MLLIAIFAASVFGARLDSDKVLLTIPASEIGKDYLLIAQVTSVPPGSELHYMSAYSQHVRWAESDGRLVLRRLQPAGDLLVSEPAARGQHDVTRLFVDEIAELGPGEAMRAEGIRTAAIEAVRAFTDRVEVDTAREYRIKDGDGLRIGLRFTLLRLPDSPVSAQEGEPRVSRSSTAALDGSGRTPRRWRLHKDRPLVYWIDPKTPRKWIPFVRAGIEDWEPAFRSAGYPNGIRARAAPANQRFPTPGESAYFHWIAGSGVDSASGNSIVDARSGEILQGHIRFHEAVLKRLAGNYFVRLAATVPQARAYPPSDARVGRLIRMLVSHEVGHTLGMAHNGKAAAAYEPRKLRDRAWLQRMGHSPTIMNYGMFNYVAQPEDRIPPEALLSRVGPGDVWTFRRLYAGASITDPEDPPWWFRSPAPGDRNDAEDRLDGIGNADWLWTIGLAVRNLERAAKVLPATRNDLRARIVGQWMDWMLQVAALVGGVRVRYGRSGKQTDPVPLDEQSRALDFLAECALNTPEFLIALDNSPAGRERVRAAQDAILLSLLEEDRARRMPPQLLSRVKTLAGGRKIAPPPLLKLFPAR